jgi:hypothetical protein
MKIGQNIKTAKNALQEAAIGQSSFHTTFVEDVYPGRNNDNNN